MTGDIHELLPLYALGVLEADEAVHVERAVAADAALAAQLAAYQQTAGELGSATEPVAPSPAVMRRLMASIGAGAFDSFATKIAAMFDVAIDRARELLGLIERPASWIPQIPGIHFVHFEGGPATAAADCGFVRISPGGMFPPHTHLGEEIELVMSGRLRDTSTDRTIGPGEQVARTEGSSHALVCIGDEDCIYATRAINGIAIGGNRIRPVAQGQAPPDLPGLPKPPKPNEPSDN